MECPHCLAVRVIAQQMHLVGLKVARGLETDEHPADSLVYDAALALGAQSLCENGWIDYHEN